MLKHLSPFILAILLIFSVEGIINFSPIGSYLDRSISNYLDKKIAQLKEDHPRKMDVLFLGTSRTGSGFNTSLFEQKSSFRLNAFNLGFQDSDYYFFKLVLEQHIKKYGKPKLILIEAADFLLNSKRLSQQEVVYFHNIVMNNPSSFIDILATSALSQDDKKETILSLISSLYRYRTLLSINGKLSDTILNIGRSLPEERMIQGWDETSVKPALLTKHGRNEIALIRVKHMFQDFDKIDTRKLQLFLNFCKQQNVAVILVRWPTIPEYHNTVAQLPIYPAINQQFSKITQEWQVPVIDLSLIPTKNVYENFADSDHLNPKGANYYTGLLYEQIQDLSLPTIKASTSSAFEEGKDSVKQS